MIATQTQPGTLASPADVAGLLRGSKAIALDLETTGLNPRRDRIRLLSVSDGRRSLVLDCFAHPIQPLLPILREQLIVAHNAAFDLGFLWHAGLTDLPEAVCTMLLSQLLDGTRTPTGWHGLAGCVSRHLQQEMPKKLQASDWSGPLSADQIEYARRDAAVLPRLHVAMTDAIEAARLVTIAEIECRALPSWVWMQQSGVPFDRPAWAALDTVAQAAVDDLTGQLDTLAPQKGLAGLFGALERWNWSSPEQVKDVLGLLGYRVQTSCDAQLATIPHKAARLLREYRQHAQLIKMYGSNWLSQTTIEDGRLYPNWRQIGTETGRTTCEKPNCQQIPRDLRYRKCFRAGPGRVLVKADYSQLQMRIAAKFADDKALLNIFQDRADVHTATAQALLGKADVNKADRQIAKSANFALLFGASAAGLQQYCKTTFGIDLTLEQAEAHRASFFRRYAGLKAWHRHAYDNPARETRTTLGRRRVFSGHTPPTEQLNTPVQGEEADGTKRALAFLWRKRGEFPDAKPVIFNHDEIVLECDASNAEPVKGWLQACMIAGMQPMLNPVPVEVEAKIVQTWGD